MYQRHKLLDLTDRKLIEKERKETEGQKETLKRQKQREI
jgi:hypothetical protein